MEDSHEKKLLSNCIFPKLEYGDLLRLRRVSKVIKKLSDEYIRNNFQEKVREVHKDNLALCLQADLPTSSLHISTKSPSTFFNKLEIPTFLRLHGNMITNVRIRNVTFPLSEPEFHFFSNLPNLQHLEVDEIDISKSPAQESDFPPNFKNLKTMKLGYSGGFTIDGLEYVWAMIDFCKKLEYIRHPFTDDEGESGYFDRIMDYIKRRAINSRGLPNLQYYDLAHAPADCSYIFDMSEEFCDLVRLCFEHKVKLLHVPGNLLFDAPYQFATSPQIFTTPIVSIKDVQWEALFGELPNLEELVTCTEDCSFTCLRRERMVRGPPKWPSLKILDLDINSREMCEAGDPTIATSLFLQFLFDRQNKREELRDLTIRFQRPSCKFHADAELPVPSSLDVALSCPFLTKLTLVNWLGTDEQVCGFWQGLPLLEEVTLDDCKKLGDAAFLAPPGNENPVFLQLTKLKELKLRCLDQMPGITDRSFELVFSRLKIKRFHLTTFDKPIESVTRAGIECLINGDFNKSVEKFPFRGWSLGSVSRKEFNELKLRFRATHMI